MMANTLRTITVAKLLELLEGESPDAQVIFAADYGDHGHTEQALPLRGELDTVTVEKTAYSNSGFAITESDDDDAATFLVIR
jgi:hypothetical protein